MRRTASLFLVAAGILAGAAGQPPPNPPSATQAPATPPAPATQPVPKTADKPAPAAPTALTEQMSPDGASGIIDTTVHGADGADIGHIIDVLVDNSGKPKAAMIDFGGFLGVGSRKVAVAWADLRFKPAAPEGMMVTLDLSADQIRTALLGKETKPPATVVVKKDPAAPAVQGKPEAATTDKATDSKDTGDEPPKDKAPADGAPKGAAPQAKPAQGTPAPAAGAPPSTK